MSKEAISPLEHLALAIGATWTIVAARWLFVSFQAVVLQSEIARTLIAIATLSIGLGVLSAFIAAGSRKLGTSAATSVAVPLSLVLFLEVLSDVHMVSGVLTFLVAIACGVLACIMLVRLLDRFPSLRLAPAGWLATATGASVIILVLSAASDTDVVGRSIALAGAVASVALLYPFWFRKLESILIPTASLIVVLLFSVPLAVRVPVHEPEVAQADERPSVLLITIDTLRADHVGAYGYDDARTVHLDKLASNGVSFLQTVSPNAFTGPSHASILSGLLPEHHGVLLNRMRLPDSVPTLAGALRREGYVTAAFVSSFTTEDESSGLPSRFDVYNDDYRAFQWLPQLAYRIGPLRIVKEASDRMGWYTGDIAQGYRMGEVTADRANSWMDAHTGKPFFLWAHLFDPHIPYRAPEQYLEPTKDPAGRSVSGLWYGLDAAQRRDIAKSPDRVAEMIALYDAEIAYADNQVGRLVEAAQRASPDRGLLIVVTSDHGEAMGEHNMFWYRDLYDPTLMVPLIIVPPETLALDPRKIDVQVRLIDIAPTILDLLDIRASFGFDGSSLVDLMKGKSDHEPRPAVSGQYWSKKEFGRDRHSVRDRGWKFIATEAGWEGPLAVPLHEAYQELYNLRTDPEETTNVIESETELQRIFSEMLRKNTQSTDSPNLNLTPAERQRLRSLGYLQ